MEESETSLPRLQVAVGTPSAWRKRFPVAGETPEHIRDAEDGKGEPRGQPREGVVGETEDVCKEAEEVVPRTETEERSVEFQEEGAEGGATEKNRPDQERPEASHGPGGSWLTKLCGSAKEEDNERLMSKLGLVTVAECYYMTAPLGPKNKNVQPVSK
ncbi:hypothetical protein NDU88_002026 [Pleurodeles waltl]|uniref:Uncharacterized protein n=1 Tax=Pleurodeles waltl TaxID=8319 RepID=A0AAV7U8J8_PLEWA|nr:hypothetical protein NDU88_002026 [Pleurodeles waltl]